MSSDYQPIACGTHSELEHAVMHRKQLKVVANGIKVEGIAADMMTKNRAEYLVLTDNDGNHHECRLDKISLAISLADNRKLI